MKLCCLCVNVICWFNQSSVMTRSLWESADCFVHHGITEVFFLVGKKNVGSGKSPVKP